MHETTPDETPGPAAQPAPRPRVRFGIFDWLDERRPLDLATLYEERLQVLEFADRAGFEYYHLAEHHWTPLNMAPSPSLFLAAVAQRTRRLRLGPMVYILPLYHPLRLVEEICMLDHLSHGRLELGVGRGVSPYELDPFGVQLEETRAIFDEALAVVVQGLATGAIDHEGRYFTFRDVRAVLRPHQRPYPPLWYPTNYPTSVPWIGQHGFSTMFGSLFPSLPAVREQFEIYHRQRAEHAAAPDRLNAHVADPCYGIVRHVYVADTDAQAVQEARAAYAEFAHSFAYLWNLHGNPRHASRGDWDTFVEQGGIYVGSPATVRARLRDALDTTGANYFAGAFAFGSLTAEQTLRSLRLFADQVIPACR
jgi:alkanesulfonate monooxygenase SsuD/methylene tetrahydromethanopterin reductase-like flavin-dependent oxidoreductase (luciferase family)